MLKFETCCTCFLLKANHVVPKMNLGVLIWAYVDFIAFFFLVVSLLCSVGQVIDVVGLGFCSYEMQSS